jgi:hypothetical protein
VESLKRLMAFMLASSISLGAQTIAPSAAPDPLAPIAWLAGGVWRGVVQGADGKTTKIETHVEPMLNGKALSFSSSFNGVMQYQGFFAYDAAKKAISFSYPSADGGLASGTVESRCGSLLSDFQLTKSNGSVGHYQVHTVQNGSDDHTWSLFASQEVAWVKLLEIHYHRTQS